MCGIIGYSGNGETTDILLSGLKRLEYRGYDSSGIAMRCEEEIITVKVKGKVSELAAAVDETSPPPARCGIGHTRWATHGEPSTANAHPHTVGKVTIVHNGIIENEDQLRSELTEKGYRFISDTDTEVLAAVIASESGISCAARLRRALGRVKGSYAVAVMFAESGERDNIYAAKRESPLIIAESEIGSFVASDVCAVMKYAKEYYIPEPEQIVRISQDGITFFDEMSIHTPPPEKQRISWSINEAALDGHPSFMHKETFEQPEIISRILKLYPISDIGSLFATELSGLGEIKRIIFTGCGSAMHAGLIGRTLIERLAGIPCEVHIASEFRYSEPLIGPGDVAVVISQSGETADTIAALRLAKAEGVPTLAIVNALGSTMSREADVVIYTHAGPETAVATTKAFTAQVTILELIAIKLAYMRGRADVSTCNELAAELSSLPSLVSDILASDGVYKSIAEKLARSENVFFIGRGQDHAVCCEGSLKLKEISYIHSEAYPAGELKHGTISLISDGTECISLATDRRIIDKTRSNARELKARGATVTAICPEAYAHEFDFCDRVLLLSTESFLAAPILSTVIFQLIAYHTAVLRGCDVDKPRNLAKSVTVE